MKRVVLSLLFAAILIGCHSVPPKIELAIKGNLKTAKEFDALYGKLISLKTAEEIQKFWEEQKCEKCGDVKEEKTHQKVKLGANIIRANKLKKWAETGEE